MAAKIQIFTFFVPRNKLVSQREVDAKMTEEINTFLFRNKLNREQVTIKQSQSQGIAGEHHTLTITLLYDK